MLERLQRYLKDHDLAAAIIAKAQPMPTVPLAAAALGVPPSHVIKSVAFEGKRSSSVCLALAPGNQRVDAKKVAAALGLPPLHLAAAATVLRATGYTAGGVPPVGHATPIPVVMERSLMTLEMVFGGGGDEWHMLWIAPREIVRATAAIIADITQSAGGVQ